MFLAAGMLCAARGMDAADFLSARIFGTTGPWLAVASLLLFASARADVLPALGRAFDLLAWTLTGLVAWEALHLRSFLRQETVAALSGYLNALYFPAAWLVLRPHAAGSPSRHLRWVPTLAYAAGSVLVQTRLNLVMLGLLVLADVWISARRAGRPVARVLEVAAVAAGGHRRSPPGWPRARGWPGSSSSPSSDSPSASARTPGPGQIAAFLTDVPATDLLLGRGARATWNWPGMSPRWPGGTDVGYLSLLFFGGIPLLADLVRRAPRSPAPGAPRGRLTGRASPAPRSPCSGARGCSPPRSRASRSTTRWSSCASGPAPPRRVQSPAPAASR